MNEIIFGAINLVYNSVWTTGQFIFVILYIIGIKKYSVTAIRTATFGFILLMLAMLLNIFKLDDIAGKVAEYVWICFAISCIQHLLIHKYETNK